MIIRFTLALTLYLASTLTVLALPHQLKSGDLVFRDGEQVDNSGFSHVGMLWITEQGI